MIFLLNTTYECKTENGKRTLILQPLSVFEAEDLPSAINAVHKLFEPEQKHELLGELFDQLLDLHSINPLFTAYSLHLHSETPSKSIWMTKTEERPRSVRIDYPASIQDNIDAYLGALKVRDTIPFGRKDIQNTSSEAAQKTAVEHYRKHQNEKRFRSLKAMLKHRLTESDYIQLVWIIQQNCFLKSSVVSTHYHPKFTDRDCSIKLVRWLIRPEISARLALSIKTYINNFEPSNEERSSNYNNKIETPPPDKG